MRKFHNSLTAERLRELLAYDELTGEFTWVRPQSNRVAAGAKAGCISHEGYLLIRVDGTTYKAHRLAWLFVNGVFPADVLDHWDTNKLNNRIGNLREVTQTVNTQNRIAPGKSNTSGLLGVGFMPSLGKWRARIMVKRKEVHIGLYDTKEEAGQAYVEAKRRLHPGCTL